jgi:hypothetical protein
MVNLYEKNIEIKCEICGRISMIDQHGNGRCKYCEWANDDDAREFPNDVRYPNMVTFERARQLVKENKPLKPTLEEFIQAYNFYGEMEFYYMGRRYGIITFDEIKFYEWNVKGTVQSFKIIEDFVDKAQIDGKLVKDVWDDVKNAFYIRD